MYGGFSMTSPYKGKMAKKRFKRIIALGLSIVLAFGTMQTDNFVTIANAESDSNDIGIRKIGAVIQY